jgi:hypothetical protein
MKMNTALFLAIDFGVCEEDGAIIPQLISAGLPFLV